jgi:uncharacterized membrane protein YecN with MAPEG domain
VTWLLWLCALLFFFGTSAHGYDYMQTGNPFDAMWFVIDGAATLYVLAVIRRRVRRRF